MRLWLILLCFGVWLCSATPVWARNIAFLVESQAQFGQQGGLLAHQLNAVFAELQRELQSELGEEEHDFPVDISAALGLPEREKALASFGTAEDLLQQAHQAYAVLELNGIEEKLLQALHRFEAYAAYVNDLNSIADALMLLGAVHTLRGQDKQAALRFEQAATLKPNIEPNPRIFNPAMRTHFAESVRNAEMRATTSLRIDSAPQGAQVMVDNVFIGITPLVTHTLKSGYHFVRLYKDAMHPAGLAVNLPFDQETSIKIPLLSCAREHQYRTLLSQTLAISSTKPNEKTAELMWRESGPVLTLSALLHADILVLATVEQHGNRLILQFRMVNSKAHTLYLSPTYTLQQNAKEDKVSEHIVEHFLVHALFPNHLAVFNARKGNALPAGVEGTCWGRLSCSQSKKLVGYGSLGIGGALLGAGVGLWVNAANIHHQWQKIAQVNSQSSLLRQRGELSAHAGDALFFMGAAFGVVGTSTLLFWHPERQFIQVGQSVNDSFNIALALQKSSVWVTAKAFF